MMTNMEIISKLKELKAETDNVYVISEINKAIDGIKTVDRNGWE